MAESLSFLQTLEIANVQRLLVVLDLDETLIHANSEALNRQADFYVGPFHVYKRPKVDLFVSALFESFDVAVWTSSSPPYAKLVTQNLFGENLANLTFIFDSRHCTQRFDGLSHAHYSRKNLAKVKRLSFDLKRVVAVDDTPRKFETHYGNLVRVPKFEGDLSDDVLVEALDFLLWLDAKENVRSVEKRGWLNASGKRIQRGA